MSAHSWKLLTIIALFIVAFLVTFQPIGKPPKEVFSTFRVTFTTPVAPQGTDFGKLTEEIKAALTKGGVAPDELDKVRIVSDREVEVSTLALDAQQAEKDKAGILTAMQAAYKGNQVAIGLPPGTEGATPAYLQLGNSLAIYSPRPRITLGLDLQGGAHVVLRCLPDSRFVFTTPEDHPMSHKALAAGQKAPTTTADGKRIVATNITPEALSGTVARRAEGRGRARRRDQG